MYICVGLEGNSENAGQAGIRSITITTIITLTNMFSIGCFLVSGVRGFTTLNLSRFILNLFRFSFTTLNFKIIRYLRSLSNGPSKLNYYG